MVWILDQKPTTGWSKPPLSSLKALLPKVDTRGDVSSCLGSEKVFFLKTASQARALICHYPSQQRGPQPSMSHLL